MRLKHVILAVEDELGEAVSTQILKRFDIEIWDTVFGEGYTYLQRKAMEFNRSAARRSQKRAVREALIPARGAILPVGNEYNAFLSEFVRDHWNLERAASVSLSLKRTLDRLAQGKNVSADQ